MSLYEERLSKHRDTIVINFHEIRSTLADYLDTDRHVQLGEGEHAVNLNREEAVSLIEKEEAIRESIAEFEKYFKIYPNKEEIEEDIRLCCGVSAFLDELDLPGNLKVGKVHKKN